MTGQRRYRATSLPYGITPAAMDRSTLPPATRNPWRCESQAPPDAGDSLPGSAHLPSAPPCPRVRWRQRTRHGQPPPRRLQFDPALFGEPLRIRLPSPCCGTGASARRGIRRTASTMECPWCAAARRSSAFSSSSGLRTVMPAMPALPNRHRCQHYGPEVHRCHGEEIWGNGGYAAVSWNLLEVRFWTTRGRIGLCR